MDTYNNMTYQQAVEKLKDLSIAQSKTKRATKRATKTFQPIHQLAAKVRKKEINYLLSIIHVHKTAMKLHAEVKRLMKEIERLQSINIRLAHQIKVD